MRGSALVLVLLLSAGCAGTLCDRIDYGGLRLERGMPMQTVQGLLGEPHLVYDARHRLVFAEKFWRLPFERIGTTEWVWLNSDPAIVVWSYEGVVTSLGTIPREVAEAAPRSSRQKPYDSHDAIPSEGVQLLINTVFLILQVFVTA